MNPNSLGYAQKVWDFLDRMELEKRYSISNLVIPENRERFIIIVKAYMDVMPWQGGLNFNKDYTKLYKINFPDESGKIPGFVYDRKIYRGKQIG
jgi:hypothetical protein